MADKPAYSGPSEGLDPKAILEVCLCHHARRAGRILTRAYDAALAPSGLTAGQFTILAAVAALNPMPIPVLREILGMDRTSLNRTLKPLEASDLIHVSKGAGRRAGHVALTPDGAAAVREAGPLWRAAQTGIAQRLGTGRTGQLLGALVAAATALHD